MALHEQILDLIYHGKFQWHDLYNMPVYLRNFYTRKLYDKIKAENEANKAAAKGSSNTPGQVHRGPFDPGFNKKMP